METSSLIRAQAMLSSGAPQIAVAAACGVDPSYIAQLLAQGTLIGATNDRDQQWNTIEDKLLARVSEIADSVTNPKAAISLLVMANKAVRRGTTSNDLAKVNNTVQVVAINVPERVRTKLTFSETGNLITQVGDRAMLTANKEQVAQTAAAVKLALQTEAAEEHL